MMTDIACRRSQVFVKVAPAYDIALPDVMHSLHDGTIFSRITCGKCLHKSLHKNQLIAQGHQRVKGHDSVIALPVLTGYVPEVGSPTMRS